MANTTPKIIALASSLLLLSPFQISADNVYKWTDKQGRVHYTNTPPSTDSIPAKLPQIMRAEVQVPQKKGESCASHGGIDCSAGADAQDGSIICNDGFKQAEAPFRFHCSSPKLSISDISDVDNEGIFRVFVRNGHSVTAKDASVLFKPEKDVELALAGPSTIEPFGIAEFVYTPQNKKELKIQPLKTQIRINCSNCS